MIETDGLTLAAPAKLNLYLHVTGKRPDGYHLLDSLVAFAATYDVIDIQPAGQLSLEINGPFASGLPVTSDNLILQAAEQLRQLAGISSGARIILTKNLPVSSGIGGGSADAAATLRGLVRLWGVHPAQHDLSGLALGLGADVPVCLYGRTAFMGGIGEQIEPIDELPHVPMVLVNPGVGISTPEIFKARTAAFSQARRFEEAPDTIEQLINLLTDDRGNDLAAPAILKQPVIGRVIEAIERTDGCRLARMSGSGATCFGFYDDVTQAEQAAQHLQHAHSNWWVVASQLISDVRALPAS